MFVRGMADPNMYTESQNECGVDPRKPKHAAEDETIRANPACFGPPFFGEEVA